VKKIFFSFFFPEGSHFKQFYGVHLGGVCSALLLRNLISIFFIQSHCRASTGPFLTHCKCALAQHWFCWVPELPSTAGQQWPISQPVSRSMPDQHRLPVLDQYNSLILGQYRPSTTMLTG
jgi:hypothetical protein